MNKILNGETVKELHAQGLTVIQIHRKTGYNKASIYYSLKNQGLVPHVTRIMNSEAAKIKKVTMQEKELLDTMRALKAFIDNYPVSQKWRDNIKKQLLKYAQDLKEQFGKIFDPLAVEYEPIYNEDLEMNEYKPVVS